MKIKLSKGKLIWAVFKSIFLVIVILYAAVAYYTVANRSISSLTNTSWLSNNQDEIIFIDEQKGLWIDADNESHFTYRAKNGYVLCHIDEKLVLELIEIEDNRLFAVNTNIMYYNEAFL